jgi:hypothetical protein
VVSLIKRELMVRVQLDVVGTVLVSLKSDGVVNQLDDHVDHRSDLCHHARTKLLRSIAVPFVALSVLVNAALTTVYYLSLEDGLLQHFVGVVLDQLSLSLLYLSLSLIDDELVRLQEIRELSLYQTSGFVSEGLYLLVERIGQGLKISINLFDDGLLSKLLLDEYLLQFLNLVVTVNGLQIFELVYELRGMDIQMLPAALLANDPFCAFGVAAHELAHLLVDLALRVYQVLRHSIIYLFISFSHNDNGSKKDTHISIHPHCHSLGHTPNSISWML